MSSITPVSSGTLSAVAIPPLSAKGQAAPVPTPVKQNPVTGEGPANFRPGYPNNLVTIDPSFDKTIVEVLNPATGTVIQQTPARHVVQLYESTPRAKRAAQP